MPNPDVLVLCGGARGDPVGGERVLELDIDAPPGSPSKVNLRLEHLAHAMQEPVPDRLEDLLRVACYVFCADQFVARDRPETLRLGATWRRNFRFKIPVADLDFWRSRKVLEQLESMLSFLSEDAYTFEFVMLRRSSRR
jgi:hypothetical protein